MLKKIIGITAVTLTLAMGQTAFADGCGEKLKDMVSSLKLDAAQKEKIKPVMEQLKTSMQGKWSQMDMIETKMKQQVQSNTMDQNVVNDLVDQKTKMIGDMMKAKITAKNQIYNTLNPQQKIQLQGMLQKVEDKMTAKFKSCHQED